MKKDIVGRKNELKKLSEIYSSKEAEFLAIYGRRRVGKTYLIRQFFQSKPCFFFEVTGLKDGALKVQLELFAGAISDTFYAGEVALEKPERWIDALKTLTTKIHSLPRNKKIILFFDELPWLATHKSGIVQAIDYYWNTRWSKDERIKLIVCGSAASWMLDKIIYAKGGLHNRITSRIHLMPFTLKETWNYLKFKGVDLDIIQVLQIYMVMGGIPYYLNAVSKGFSAVQNISRICFQPDGLLLDEFDRLYASLFENSDIHVALIKTLAKHRSGMSRNELLAQNKRMTSGGRFKKRLLELEEVGFVTSFIPYGRAKKGTYYRIIDEFTLFYLHWIQPFRRKMKMIPGVANYWETKENTQAYKSWSGYAFEAVCLKHTNQISNALDINSIAREFGSWRYITNKNEKSDANTGSQIDLLIDRADGIINVCEIKYHNRKFSIDKAYAKKLREKMDTFAERTQTNKQLFLTMITVHGVSKNKYSRELVNREITLRDLFI